MKSYSLLFTLVLSCSAAIGQDVLTLEQAVELALQNNNLLKVAQIDKQLAANNVSWGAAGFLPNVNLNASNNFANNQLRQRIYSPASGATSDITRNGVSQSNWNGNVNFNWLLFNGFRRNNLYERLKVTYERADAATKVQIENTVSDVSQRYLEIVRQVEIAQAYQNNLNLYLERLRLAEARHINGLVSKSDVLITKVDINTQKALLITQSTNVANARVALNNVLNREPSSPFVVDSNAKQPVTDTSIQYNQKATSLLTTEKDVVIAERLYKETNANYYPLLNLVATYNFNRVQSEAGQVLLNQTNGPNIGFTFTWNLFDGFNRGRIRSASLLNVDASRILHQENIRTQKAAFQSSLNLYKNSVRILQLEVESYDLAKESNDIAHERYKSGSINLFEYKETQRALEDSKVRLANARFNALSAEVELRRLNGELVR